MDKERLQNLFDQMKKEKEMLTDRDSRVLIVDGLNLFVASFAASPAMNHRGDHVGGLLGFMKSLFAMIRKFNPTRCIVAFDGKDGAMLRRKKYPAYKSERRSKDNYNRFDDMVGIVNEEDSFAKQIARLDTYLKVTPVTPVIMDYIEADDIIGYLVNEYYQSGTKDYKEIVVVSADQDFLQLVSEDVKVYSPIKRKLYDVDLMRKEFKIPPENYLTLKTFMGDSSDNIKGVNGVGLKTMLKMYPEFADQVLTTEDIIQLSEQKIAGGSKLKTYRNVVSSSEQLKLNWELMQLANVDIPSSKKLLISEIVSGDINRFNKKKLKQYFYEDGLNQHLKYFDSWIISSLSQIELYAEAD